jgi:hypothetical protein
MTQEDEVARALDFACSLTRPFAPDDLLDFVCQDAGLPELSRRLADDKRFLLVRDDTQGEDLYFPNSGAFRWLLRLNLRLAWARCYRLTEQQVVNLLSGIKAEGKWTRVPESIGRLGSDTGLMCRPLTPGQFVFPLGYIMAQVPPDVASIAANWVDLLTCEPLGRELNLNPDELYGLNERERAVVSYRLGARGGTGMTLEEIGRLYGLTRGRVCQIEQSALRKLRVNEAHMLAELLLLLIRRAGSLLVADSCAESSRVKWWCRVTKIRVFELPHIDTAMMGLDLRSSLRVGFPSSVDAQELAHEIECEDQPPIGCGDLKVVSARIAEANRQRLTRAQRVYLALRTLGRPAHYAEVAEVHNSIFPERASTERNIHGTLGREQHGVVWVGAKGTFALKEWGYERPSQSLFEAAARIVREKHAESANPVGFNTILAEMGKYRKLVKLNSLLMALHLNPAVRATSTYSFVPRGEGEIEEEGDLDQLDGVLREFEKH